MAMYMMHCLGVNPAYSLWADITMHASFTLELLNDAVMKQTQLSLVICVARAVKRETEWLYALAEQMRRWEAFVVSLHRFGTSPPRHVFTSVHATTCIPHWLGTVDEQQVSKGKHLVGLQAPIADVVAEHRSRATATLALWPQQSPILAPHGRARS
ncbi:hypothetical protein HaLaN_03189, partial [Haematococcus lacustris]